MTQSFLCPTFRSLHIAFIAFQNCSCLFSEIPIEAERIHCDMDPTVQSSCPLSRSKGPMLHLWVQDLPGYLGSCSMLFGPTGATWCNMVQHGATWCNMVQHGATWCNMVQRNMVQHSATWCNMVQRLKWGHDVRSHRSLELLCCFNWKSTGNIRKPIGNQ